MCDHYYPSVGWQMGLPFVITRDMDREIQILSGLKLPLELSFSPE